MANRVNHQEIVNAVLKSKSVDFAAIGKTFGEIGPSLSLADEPWESFCGTMRYFIRVFILNPFPGGPLAGQFQDLSQLREVAAELKG